MTLHTKKVLREMPTLSESCGNPKSTADCNLCSDAVGARGPMCLLQNF